MKKRTQLSVLICMTFLSMLFLPGLTKNACGEVNEEKTTLTEQSDGTLSTKEEFKIKAKEKLTEFEKKMQELEEKAKETGATAKADVKKGMKEVKEKHEALVKEIKKLDAAGKQTWETAKQKVDAGIEKLQKALDKMRSHLKSE